MTQPSSWYYESIVRVFSLQKNNKLLSRVNYTAVILPRLNLNVCYFKNMSYYENINYTYFCAVLTSKYCVCLTHCSSFARSFFIWSFLEVSIFFMFTNCAVSLNFLSSSCRESNHGNTSCYHGNNWVISVLHSYNKCASFGGIR